MKKFLLTLLIIGLLIGGGYYLIPVFEVDEMAINWLEENYGYVGDYPVDFEFDRESEERSYNIIPHEGDYGSRLEVYGVDKEGDDLLDGVENIIFYEARFDDTYTSPLSAIDKYYVRNMHTDNPDVRIEKIDLEHVNSNTDGRIQILNQDKEMYWLKNCYDSPFKSSDEYDEKYQSNQFNLKHAALTDVLDDMLTAIRFRDWEREDVVIYQNNLNHRFHYYDIEIDPELPDDLFTP